MTYCLQSSHNQEQLCVRVTCRSPGSWNKSDQPLRHLSEMRTVVTLDFCEGPRQSRILCIIEPVPTIWPEELVSH